MAGLCLAAGAIAAALPLSAFTLAWTHSIEKIRWEEDYRLVDRRMVLIEARIRGAGAGMEPPAGAVLKDGAWRYRPALAPLERLRLTHSPYAKDYEICADGRCQSLPGVLPGLGDNSIIEVGPCPP